VACAVPGGLSLGKRVACRVLPTTDLRLPYPLLRRVEVQEPDECQSTPLEGGVNEKHSAIPVSMEAARQHWGGWLATSRKRRTTDGVRARWGGEYFRPFPARHLACRKVANIPVWPLQVVPANELRHPGMFATRARTGKVGKHYFPNRLHRHASSAANRPCGIRLGKGAEP
jgi:hypothetical protein